MEFSLQAALNRSRLKPELRTTSSRAPLCRHGVQPSGCTESEQAKAPTPNHPAGKKFLVGFLSASLRVQLFLSRTIKLLDSGQVVVMERLVYLLEVFLGLRSGFALEENSFGKGEGRLVVFHFLKPPQ